MLNSCLRTSKHPPGWLDAQAHAGTRFQARDSHAGEPGYDGGKANAEVTTSTLTAAALGTSLKPGTATIARSLRHAFLALLLLFAAASPSLAVEPSEQLKNPALEARARAIGAGLRCLVCQNETIDESGAGLAHDIRILLRERLAAGDTDQQAVQAIVNRYGEFVLLDPPVRPATYVLWFGPFAILLAGLIGGAVWLRRRGTITDTATPLNQDEQTRLESIMREADR